MPAGMLGATAAFVFAAQMINMPVAPGISGHLVGAALAAVLLGPWRAVIVMAVVLAVQALLFQDGGITALGANTLDMGVAASLTGYAVAPLSSRWRATLRARVVGGVLGAFAATLVSAVLTALWLGLSGLYPLVPVVQLLLVTHVAIGLLEAALTGAVLATVVRWRPDLRSRRVGASVPRRRALAVAGGAVRRRASRSRRSSRRSRRRCRTASITPPSGSGSPAARPPLARAVPGLRGAVPFVARDRHRRRRASPARLLAAVVAWGVSRGVQAGRS